MRDGLKVAGRIPEAADMASSARAKRRMRLARRQPRCRWLDLALDLMPPIPCWALDAALSPPVNDSRRTTATWGRSAASRCNSTRNSTLSKTARDRRGLAPISGRGFARHAPGAAAPRADAGAAGDRRRPPRPMYRRRSAPTPQPAADRPHRRPVFLGGCVFDHLVTALGIPLTHDELAPLALRGEAADRQVRRHFLGGGMHQRRKGRRFSKMVTKLLMRAASRYAGRMTMLTCSIVDRNVDEMPVPRIGLATRITRWPRAGPAARGFDVLLGDTAWLPRARSSIALRGCRNARASPSYACWPPEPLGELPARTTGGSGRIIDIRGWSA